MHLKAASTSPLAALAALQVLSSGMLRTAVDDGVVDFGLFFCTSRLAAWQEPIEPGVQQLPAALSRGRSLARAQLQHPEHERERPAGSVHGRASGMAGKLW